MAVAVVNRFEVINIAQGQAQRLHCGACGTVFCVKAGFKGTHLRPTLESAARIKTNRPESLSDYPSRLLLQMIGRGPPDLDIVVRDLGNLLRAASPVAPTATPEPGPAPAGGDTNSPDTTR